MRWLMELAAANITRHTCSCEACTANAWWINYTGHVQVVEPKRVALRGAEAMLIGANAQLQEKQAALKAVEGKVAGLEAALAAAEAEQASLKEQASVTATRLQRAAKLTSALQEEGVRWGNTAGQIKVSSS